MSLFCITPELTDSVTAVCNTVSTQFASNIYKLTCDGTITEMGGGAYQCSVDWVSAMYDSSTFDPSQLDPGLMAAFIGSGFFILLPLWAASAGVVWLLKTIKGI